MASDINDGSVLNINCENNDAVKDMHQKFEIYEK